MKRVYLLLLVLLVFHGQNVLACECITDPTSKGRRTAYNKYDVIFVGRVTVVDTERWVEDFSTPGNPHYLFEVDDDFKKLPRVYSVSQITFDVETPYKGVFDRSIPIFTRSGGKDCGFEFVRGEKYVVFAARSSNVFKTSICTPTKKLHGAEEIVSALDRLAAAYRREAAKFGWLDLAGAKALAVQLAEKAFVENEYRDASGNRMQGVRFSPQRALISLEDDRWSFVWTAPAGPWARVSFDRDGSAQKVEAGHSSD